MSVRIDATDRKILAALQADAAQSLDEIAKTVGSSKTPVWNRIRKMREAGIIGQHTVMLDAEALGFEVVRIRVMGGKTNTLQVMAERPDGAIDVGDPEHVMKVAQASAAFFDVGFLQENGVGIFTVATT